MKFLPVAIPYNKIAPKIQYKMVGFHLINISL